MKPLSLALLLFYFVTSVNAQDPTANMWYLNPGMNGQSGARLGENTPSWSQVNQGSGASETYIPFRFNRTQSRDRSSSSSDAASTDLTSVTNINQYAQSFGVPPAAVCRVGDEVPPAVSTPRPSPLRPLPGLTSAFDVGLAGAHPRDRDISGQEYCSQFIKSDGSYGAIGEYIVELIRAQSSDRSITRDDLPTMQGDSSICQNWSQLTQEEREHFWVWSVAAIAWDESKCGHKDWMRNRSNREAVGMLQMNHSPSGRNFRGQACRTSASESIMEHRPNVRCGVHILTDLLNPPNMYQTDGNLIAPNSYWDKLRRPSNGTIDEKVASYPLCR